MSLMEEEIGEGTGSGSFWKQPNLWLGAWSQFCYVGAQVAVANYFIQFCEQTGQSQHRGSQLLSAAQGIYAGMRFVIGFVLMSPKVKPRYILLAFLSCCFVFIIAAMNTTGTTSIGLLMMVLAFESACFATIFTLALRGLGRHTKKGGSVMVAAISGGTVFPPITGAVIDRKGAHFAMIIPAMGYILALAFPIYVNFFNWRVMDAHRETKLNVEPRNEKELELERAQTGDEKDVMRTVEEVETR